MQIRIHRLGVLVLAIVASLVFSPGCAARYGTIVNQAPTLEEQAEVRRLAARSADVLTAGLKVVDDTGKLIAALPLATDVKDRYDCGVLKVVGLDAPSPTVQRICGSVPSAAASPLTIAREKLKALTTCASLRSTLTVLLGAVDPLISSLADSGQVSLVYASGAIRVAFSFIRMFLESGGTCSQP